MTMTYLRPLHVIFALLLLTLQSTAYGEEGIPRRDSHEYGKTLLTEFDVPDSVIAKYNNRQPPKAVNVGGPMINMLLSDSVDWTSDPISISNQINPYRIVVTVTGSAISDGDAVSMWTAGWFKASDGTTNSKPLTGLSKHGVKAGQTFMVTAAALPTTFKQDQELGASLGMVKTTNMTINAVHVQIWSGVASASFTQIFFSLQGLVVALILLGLGWFFKRR